MSYKELTVRFYENGKIEYYNKAGELHNDNGPATVRANGDKYWCINGQLHNDNGPAAVWADGDNFWYIDDKRLTEAEFNARKGSCQGKVVEIDGKKYKLTAV